MCDLSRKLVSDFFPICPNPLTSVALRLESTFPKRSNSHLLHGLLAVDAKGQRFRKTAKKLESFAKRLRHKDGLEKLHVRNGEF